METKKTVAEKDVRKRSPGLDQDDWASSEDKHSRFRPKLGGEGGETAEIKQRKLEWRHRNSGRGREFLWRTKQKVLSTGTESDRV